MVGLSITDSTGALLLLTLGQVLAQRGFMGHITCGGGFATLERKWLLNRHAWLCSVVRLKGEAVLPALVRTVFEQRDIADVPGVTTREGDGLPAPVHSSTPMSLWPTRDNFPEFLHHPAASIMASRGCTGTCDYCGPASLQHLEREEALAQNVPYPCGNGRIRRRTVADSTDEQLLPASLNAARAFLDELKNELHKKKVRNYGFSAQLEGHQISPEIVHGPCGCGNGAHPPGN